MNEQRRIELEALDWNELKTLAQSLGIDKPEQGQWKDVIPLILEQEATVMSPNVQEAADSEAVASLRASAVQAVYNAVAVTETRPRHPDQVANFFQALNLQTCPKCGEKRRSDLMGSPVCAIADSDCPVVQKG